MPPVVAGIAAAGTWVATAIGATGAMAAVVSAAVVGAIYGTVIGAATALVTGGDVLEGALKGAGIGLATGAVGGALGQLGNAGMQTAEAGLGAEAGVGAMEGANLVEGGTEIAAASGAAGDVVTAAPAAATAPVSAVPTVSQAPQAGGLLSKAGSWIETNPAQAMLLGQSVGGAAEAMAESRSSKKQLEADMERDRLNRDALKIKGLTQIDLKTALPTISGFMERPKWQMPDAGLLWGEQQNANAKTA